jgi:hypothetical protein
MQSPHDPRRVSRRSFLGSSALTVIVAFVVESCGGNASSGAASTAAPATTSAPGSTSASNAASSSIAPTSPTSAAAPGAASTTVAQAPVAGTGLAASELELAFSYIADTSAGGAPSGGQKPGGGRGGFKNPYIAVWIEDPAGNEVRTVSLNYQRGKGDRWLDELRRWYRAEQAAGKDLIDTYSSATRQPGDYKVVWDGRNSSGEPAAAGTYFVCIEASREKGPYSLIREQLKLDGNAFDQPLANQGELQNASAKFVSKA